MRPTFLRALLVLALAGVSLGQEKKTPEPRTLEKLKTDYAALMQEEPRINKIIEDMRREERDLIKLMGVATQADEDAARHPEDAALRKTADELSARVKMETEGHNQRKAAARREISPYNGKLGQIFGEINLIEQKNPDDEQVLRFKVAFAANGGAVSLARDEVDKLWAKHADERDIRFFYAESRMVAPLVPKGANYYHPPDFSEAFLALEPLAKAEPANQEVQLLYGVAASAIGSNSIAANVLGGIADITSVRSSVRTLLGNAEDPEAAFATWRDTAKGLDKDPNDSALRMKRAELLFVVDANDRAIAEGEIVIKAKPDDHAATVLLARTYTRAMRYEEAGKLYDKLGPEMETNIELRTEHALFLIAGKKHREGIAELMKVPDIYRLQPRLTESVYHAIQDMRAGKQADTELQGLLMLIQADQGGLAVLSDSDSPRIGPAHNFWAMHKEDAAMQRIFAATLINMSAPNSMRGHPAAPPAAPRFAWAHELLEPLVAAAPDDKELLLLDGVTSVALGLDQKAQKELDAVATLDSMRSAFRDMFGKHSFHEWKALADGLAAKPDDPELRKKRGELLESVHAAPSFRARDFEAALRGKPDDPELKKSLARTYHLANHFEKAIPLFKELPDADDVHAECAVCMIGANRFAEAKDEIAKVKEPQKLPPQIGKDFLTLKLEIEKLAALFEDEKKAREADAKKDDCPRLQFETKKGKIVLELFEDSAPNTVANIISLSESGFYNGVSFHRIIAGFMAQGGDPTGQGNGGPGYTIKDELVGNPRMHWRGTLSMAHAGANTGGSQFFLCFSPTPDLNGRHTVFGRIVEGQEVADELEIGDTIAKATVLRKRAHEYKVEAHLTPHPQVRVPINPHGAPPPHGH